MNQYLNNSIEQDHRFIKNKINPMLGFKSFDTAKRALCGIEVMHMIHKGQIEGIRCVNSEIKFIEQLMLEVA